MFSRIRVILLTAVLTTAAVLAAVPAARATVSVTEQIDQAGYSPNFWNGGLALSAYHGTTANNAIQIQSIPPRGYFQLLDRVHGDCVGDNLGLYNATRAGGGNTCNSTVTGTGGDPGTVFQIVDDAVCSAGFHKYWNRHALGYLGFADSNGSGVYLNTRGNCLVQVTRSG